MANYFITGTGKESFCQKLMELNSDIKSIDGIIVDIPDDTMTDTGEYIKTTSYLSSSEGIDVRITKLHC